MLKPPRFCVTADTLREQISACDVLLASLEADRHAALEALFRVLLESGYCQGCGPEAITRLGINRGGALPVPVLDVSDTGDDGWAGLHGRFLAGHAPKRHCGHFVARNCACVVTAGFAREEFLESAKEHETVHILQAMSGRDSEPMTRDERALCKGHVGLLPTLASQRKLSTASQVLEIGFSGYGAAEASQGGTHRKSAASAGEAQPA